MSRHGKDGGSRSKRDDRKNASPPIVAGRVPPHNLDAEAAVLSAVLLDVEALDRVQDILLPEHFYSDANGKIFEATLELAKAHIPIDIVNVASKLRDKEILAQIGGPSYLAQLADATPAVAHVASHAQVIYEKWRMRTLIATCQRIAAEGYGDVGDVQQFIDGAEQSIYEIARTARKSTIQPVSSVLREEFGKIQAAADRGQRVSGIPTGYDKVDALTAGLHVGDLMIVAARPGMGKTAWVLNAGVNVASPRCVPVLSADQQTWQMPVEPNAPGYGVCVFSLEMPRGQLAMRMVCAEARVDLGKVRQGCLQPDDWRKLTEAAAYLSSLPLWIDDTSALTILELRAKVRRIQAEYNREATATTAERKVGLVVVDYLQLMSGEGESREQIIAEISRGLKALSKELDVPVIALSQLNRAVETRGKDKRPQLSDLRESGSLEQDADTIFFIYRDEYYNPETTKAKGIAELICAKQRNGPPGKALLRFTAGCTRFDNLALGDYPELEAEER